MLKLLSVSIALVLFLTLWPLELRPFRQAPDVFTILISSVDVPAKRGDVVRNILLFMPLGYAAARIISRTRTAWPALICVVLASAGLSLMVEIAQVYIVRRTPSLFDVASNTLGAGLGGAIAFGLQMLIVGRRRIIAD
jgi:VanZ family protein